MLYRVFPWIRDSELHAPGGPLFVPRAGQGSGRHDNPEHYGALYTSRNPVSAIAEAIQPFRGRTLRHADLMTPWQAILALARLDDSALESQIDLDDPRELLRRRLRPSQVATGDRRTTRSSALAVFRDGATGVGWWSTLEASWPNVTLFAERTRRGLRLASAPEPLRTDHPDLVTAAERLGVRVD